MGSVPICVGNLSDLPDPACREFSWGEGPVPLRGFLLRRGGLLVAYLNSCPHARRPLNWLAERFLDASGTRIVCTGHGAEFDIASGRCLAGPCAGQSLTPLGIELAGGKIYVDPDPAVAPPGAPSGPSGG